jgi:hypothetical protein
MRTILIRLSGSRQSDRIGRDVVLQVPFDDDKFWHTAIEPCGPDGECGQRLTYSMVLIPAAGLARAWLKDFGASAAAAHG